MSAILVTYANVGTEKDASEADILPVIRALEDAHILQTVICRRDYGSSILHTTSVFPWWVVYGLRLLEKIGLKLTRPQTECLFDHIAAWRLQPCDVVFFHGGYFLPRTLKKARKIARLTVDIARIAHPRTNAEIEKYEYDALKIAPDVNSYARLSGRTHHLIDFDKHIVHSEFVRESYIDNGIPAARIVLAPIEINTKEFIPKEDRAKGFTVLYIAYTKPLKGLHYLLEAWQGIEFKDAELIVVGGFADLPRNLRDQYENIIATDDRIKIISSTKDLIPLYQSASVFVFPSLTEGFGRVTLEAMACGVPVITTINARGIVEDGVTGFVVPIKDPDAIREKLEYLYLHRDRASEMRQRARESVLRHRGELAAAALRIYRDSRGPV